MSDAFGPLATFIECGGERGPSLAVVNRTRPRPIQNMLEGTVDDDRVRSANRYIEAL